MKAFLALFVGVVIGALAVWFFTSRQGRSTLEDTGAQIDRATQPARDALEQKISEWRLNPEQVKEELARTGQVVRRKSREAGQAVADATADARITASIKGKLLADSRLSALSVSVNTTDGLVTLSGSVSAPEDIGRAMVLAMETDGVREVVSTLQVRARPAQKKK